MLHGALEQCRECDWCYLFYLEWMQGPSRIPNLISRLYIHRYGCQFSEQTSHHVDDRSKLNSSNHCQSQTCWVCPQHAQIPINYWSLIVNFTTVVYPYSWGPLILQCARTSCPTTIHWIPIPERLFGTAEPTESRVFQLLLRMHPSFLGWRFPLRSWTRISCDISWFLLVS